MNTFEAIRSRRSIRRFKTDDIPHEIITHILEAARWAPSWKNSQCPRFVVVEDSSLKQKIARNLTGNRAYEGVLEAPALVVVCAQMGKSGYSAGVNVTDKGDWYMFDSALAVQNILLAGWSIGIGSVIIGYFDSQNIASIIDLPEGYTVVNLIAMGYPDESPSAPPRKPIDQICFLNYFGGEIP